jgi:glutathione reductase (NADPH)
MDYSLIPKTVFSNTEYSTVGMEEAEAIQKFGDENIDVFHSEFPSFESSIVLDQHLKTSSYMKVFYISFDPV